MERQQIARGLWDLKSLPEAPCPDVAAQTQEITTETQCFAFISDVSDPFSAEVLHQLHPLGPRLLQEHEDTQAVSRAAWCSLLPKGSLQLSCSQEWARGWWTKPQPRKPFLMRKSSRQPYEEKPPLAMATTFSELCDKCVILVHVSFFTGITQAHVKQ